MKYQFNVKDQKDTEVLNAFCDCYGYKSVIITSEGAIPNPESKKDFAERMLKEIFIDPYVSVRRNQAAHNEGENAKGDT